MDSTRRILVQAVYQVPNKDLIGFRQQVVICAVTGGVITHEQGNELSKQFSLGLRWDYSWSFERNGSVNLGS